MLCIHCRFPNAGGAPPVCADVGACIYRECVRARHEDPTGALIYWGIVTDYTRSDLVGNNPNP
jgi:hypothetical protein